MTTPATEPVVPPTEPVVPPTTPAAPVVPPTEPAIPAETPAEAVVPETWTPSGDSLVDTIAKGYLEKGGSVAQFQALLDDVGNTGALTEAAKVELKRTFGDMAEALIPSIEAKAKANLEYVTRERKAVFDAVGGESKFAEMQDWAKTNLDDATRGFISNALNQGGKAAQMAVKTLTQLMIEGGATMEGTTHKADGAAATNDDALTLQTYLNEKATLTRAGNKAGVEALEARARVAIKSAAARGVKWR